MSVAPEVARGAPRVFAHVAFAHARTKGRATREQCHRLGRPAVIAERSQTGVRYAYLIAVAIRKAS